ncbi:MAG TPA: multidrug ABC transporter ATP-binding protein [Firmicutes bacterium]|nr:multidrug ABC transporter ATP-binding protein [Bacillota bacterium]
MFKLIKYLKGSAIVFAIIGPLMMLIEVAMDLLQPALLSDIIDVGVANQDINYVLRVGAMMLGVAVIGAITGMSCSFFAATASMKLGEEIREELFAKIQTLSFLDLDKFKTSSLITRLTNDVTQVQTMMNITLKMAVRAPFTCLGGLILAVMLSPKLSSVFLIAIPFIVVAVVLVVKKSSPLFKQVQMKLDQLNVVMRENILGTRVIKSFNLEAYEKKRFNGTNEDLTNVSIVSQNMNYLLIPITSLIMNITVVAILWFGGNMVNVGDLEVGKIIAFVNYAIQIMGSTMMAINLMINFSRANASADRINEVLEATPSISQDKETEIETYDIEFKNVSFKYNEGSELVLEDISFKAKQGQKIGIIGSTGSGKSSFVHLIPRLYDVSEGEVLIGGVNVKDISLKQLRHSIGVVLQESILFSGTIESNLKFGDDKATSEFIEQCVKDAQAYEFISTKEDGYQTRVEQRAKNLSGGQKQRLSIARTLVKDPKILIMDDCSSALDMSTEAKLQAAIQTRYKETTVFIIAQRISGVMDADQIIVMDQGRIANVGTHEELLKSSDIYRSIAALQLGEEVLINE